MKAWVRIPILLVGLLLIALPTSAQQPRSLAELSIISEQITSTDEGRVSVDFVVRGSDGFGVFDLTAGSVQLSEPANQVTLTETPRLNLTVGFIVDLSAGSNAPLIRETLRAWFRTFYREGDPVTLYILDGDTRQPRIVAIEDANQARDVINGLRTAPIFHRLEDTLPRVLSDMRAVGDAPTRPRHVVYVGSFLTAPREVNDAAAFAELGVPLHVIQAHQKPPHRHARTVRGERARAVRGQRGRRTRAG